MEGKVKMGKNNRLNSSYNTRNLDSLMDIDGGHVIAGK